MKIIVEKDKILKRTEDKSLLIFNYGAEHIKEAGFQAVDNVVDFILKDINSDEEVFVEGDGVEAKMIARKLEDRLRREVNFNFGKNK